MGVKKEESGTVSVEAPDFFRIPGVRLVDRCKRSDVAADPASARSGHSEAPSHLAHAVVADVIDWGSPRRRAMTHAADRRRHEKDYGRPSHTSPERRSGTRTAAGGFAGEEENFAVYSLGRCERTAFGSVVDRIQRIHDRHAPRLPQTPVCVPSRRTGLVSPLPRA